MIGRALVSRWAISQMCTAGAGVALALAALAPQAHAQTDLQQRLTAFKAAQGQNAAAQRSYTWLETTQMALKGEVKSTESTSCQYAAGSNKPQCTPVGAPPEEKKQRGPVRKHVVEQKTEEMKAYMDSVKALVAEYVPPQHDRIQAAQARGDVAAGERGRQHLAV